MNSSLSKNFNNSDDAKKSAFSIDSILSTPQFTENLIQPNLKSRKDPSQTFDPIVTANDLFSHMVKSYENSNLSKKNFEMGFQLSKIQSFLACSKTAKQPFSFPTQMNSEQFELNTLNRLSQNFSNFGQFLNLNMNQSTSTGFSMPSMSAISSQMSSKNIFLNLTREDTHFSGKVPLMIFNGTRYKVQLSLQNCQEHLSF